MFNLPAKTIGDEFLEIGKFSRISRPQIGSIAGAESFIVAVIALSLPIAEIFSRKAGFRTGIETGKFEVMVGVEDFYAEFRFIRRSETIDLSVVRLFNRQTDQLIGYRRNAEMMLRGAVQC